MVSDVLQNKDHIVGKILENTDLDKPGLEEKILAKVHEYGGLLTDAGAAYAIAKDLGVDCGFDSEAPHYMKIAELKQGLEAVDLTATVSRITPVKEWSKQGRTGKVCNLVLKDDTGEIRLVLWNTQCDPIEKNELTRGSVLDIRNAFVKGNNGMLEIGVGRYGEIKVTKTASVEENITSLRDLKEGMNDVTCYARVKRVFPLNEFEKNGKKGKVASVIITDGEERRLVLWNENADQTKDLKPDEIVKVEGGYVKTNNDILELHLGFRGRLVQNPNNAPKIDSTGVFKDCEVKDLEPGMQAKVTASVVRVFTPNTFPVCPKCGTKAEGTCEKCETPTQSSLVFNAELDDGTAVIRAVLYRKTAEEFLGFTGNQFAEQETLFSEKDVLGERRVFKGYVKHNKLFDRDEFVIQTFTNPDEEDELEIQNQGVIE